MSVLFRLLARLIPIGACRALTCLALRRKGFALALCPNCHHIEGTEL